eukprot:gene13924-22957_t
MFALGLLITSVIGQQPTPPGVTFGNGIAGIPICDTGSVVLNHTVSDGATHGVMHHFWTTGAEHIIDMIQMEYYIDGETTPSIAFQPALMCGMAFPARIEPTDMYSAGGMCGKNAAVGGWFNTFPIPFSKSILVLARNPNKGCTNGYINAIHQPNTFVNVSSFPAGTKGLHFQTTWAVELQPVGGSGAGGLVIGTGVEDYFDSGYYFGGDTFLHKGLLFQNQLSGLTFFERTKDDYERLSAYRFHAADPLVFNNGGGVVWQVGCGKPPTKQQNATEAEVGALGMTKCGNPVPQATGPLPPQQPFPPPPPASPSPPPSPAPAQQPVKAQAQENKADPDGLGRSASPVTLTTYGWAKGVTEENWTAVCEGLRKGKGFGVPPPSALPGIGGGFESAIGHANDDLFDGLGLVGVYAEYGPGQKAMVVLDKTQTDKFVLPSLRIF